MQYPIDSEQYRPVPQRAGMRLFLIVSYFHGSKVRAGKDVISPAVYSPRHSPPPRGEHRTCMRESVAIEGK